MITLKAKGSLDDRRHRLQGRDRPRARGRRPASGDRRLGPRAVLRRHAAGSAGRLRRRDAEGGRDRARDSAEDRQRRRPKAISISAARSASTRRRRSASREIRLRFDVDTDAPQDKLDQLLKLTERYCVVYQTIKNGPKVSVTMKRM